MNKLCLIWLPAPYLRDKDMFIPLGLLYIAAASRNRGWDVELLDMKSGSVPIPDADVYGIGATSPQWEMACRTAIHINRFLKRPVFIGGSHASALPVEAQKDTGCTIVVGEGEYTNWRSTNENILYQPVIRDIDTLPFPAWDLWYKGNIGRVGHSTNGGLAATVYTSRGCPFECTFCSPSVFGRTVRRRSVDGVMEEINILLSMDIDFIRFLDDTFTIDSGWLAELCHSLIPLKIEWGCQTRADCLSPAMLELMRKAGCKVISIGVETACPEALLYCKKGETAEEMLCAVLDIKRSGIKVKVFLIEGIPCDDSRYTIEWLRKAKPDMVTLSQFSVLPGSEEYARASYARHVTETFVEEFRLDKQTKLGRFIKNRAYMED